MVGERLVSRSTLYSQAFITKARGGAQENEAREAFAMGEREVEGDAAPEGVAAKDEARSGQRVG